MQAHTDTHRLTHVVVLKRGFVAFAIDQSHDKLLARPGTLPLLSHILAHLQGSTLGGSGAHPAQRGFVVPVLPGCDTDRSFSHVLQGYGMQRVSGFIKGMRFHLVSARVPSDSWSSLLLSRVSKLL